MTPKPSWYDRIIRRTALNLAAALSAALVLAIGILWPATWPDAVGLEKQGRTQTDRLLLLRGKVAWEHCDLRGTLDLPPSARGWQWRRHRNPPPSGYPAFLGIEWVRSRPVHEIIIERWQYIAIPCWLVMPLLAILPALRLRAWQIRRRGARVGLCGNCGYDLRATPERCPECGMAAKAAAYAVATPVGR